MVNIALHKRSESFSSMALTFNILLILGSALMIILGLLALCMLIHCPPNRAVNIG